MVQKNKLLITKLIYSYYLHGSYLENENFYSKNTNHGLEQSRVLLLLSQTITAPLYSSSWLKIAESRIYSELEYSFTSEGIHVENSPGYHVFVLKVFINMISEYPYELFSSLRSKLLPLAEKSLEFIYRIMRPDAKLPILGDTEQISTTDGFFNLLSNTAAYQHFKYATSKGNAGSKPTQLQKVYSKSGYAIFRDNWPTPENYQDSIHIIIKAGCLSQYHHQQDEGNILLYAYGTDWLIDSGLYSYNQKDPYRKYMRSRYAHNIPIISGSKYDDKFSHRKENWNISDFSENEENPFIKMEINVLKTSSLDPNEFESIISHQRTVHYKRDVCELIVSEIIRTLDTIPRNAYFLWHIPKDKIISIRNNVITVHDKIIGKNLSITTKTKSPFSLKIYHGNEHNTFKSFISRQSNEIEESQVIVITFDITSFLDVEFKFHFHI